QCLAQHCGQRPFVHRLALGTALLHWLQTLAARQQGQLTPWGYGLLVLMRHLYGYRLVALPNMRTQTTDERPKTLPPHYAANPSTLRTSNACGHGVTFFIAASALRWASISLLSSQDVGQASSNSTKASYK